DLEKAVMEYISKHNESPAPFIWTKSANDILSSPTIESGLRKLNVDVKRSISYKAFDGVHYRAAPAVVTMVRHFIIGGYHPRTQACIL
ncbi:MAG: hypothetical protein AB2807_10635, partial [Candidatus Sedimenticola endophacoides]